MPFELLESPRDYQQLREIGDLRRPRAKERAAELLEHFRLDSVPRKQSDGTYSAGMRRHIDLTGTIVALPPALVLDELTTGLDPQGDAISGTRSLICETQGKAILLTTQYLERPSSSLIPLR